MYPVDFDSLPDMIPTSVQRGQKTATGLLIPGQVVSAQARRVAPSGSPSATIPTALAHVDHARRFFDGLAFTHRQEWVRWIEKAKKPVAGSTRVDKAVVARRPGKRGH